MDNHKRFREILLNVLNNKGYIVYADDYPDYLEVDIQRAVYYKRNKRYDEAIKIYLDVFENCKGVYPSIMEYLYKAVLCNGELVFAYETILYAELFAKKCWGYHSFLGDWSQAIKRKEFENIIIEYFKQPRSFLTKENEEISKETINSIFSNTSKVNNMIKEVASRYSGQQDYSLPADHNFKVSSMLGECGKIYDHFHSRYADWLK